VKTSVQEAFRNLIQSGCREQRTDDGELPMETSTMVPSMEPQPLQADPKNLMGSHGESRQEK
jgi:hypothetical protein